MTNGGDGFGGPSPIGGSGDQGMPGAGGWDAIPPQGPGQPGAQQWGAQQPPVYGASGPQNWSSSPGQQSWPSGPGQPLAGPPQFDAQYSPYQEGGGKRNKALIITLCAGAAVLLAIVLVVVFAFAGRGGTSSSSAGAAVQGYLAALQNGDAEKALSYGADQPASKELLSDEILKKQIAQAPISNIRILSDDSKNSYGMGEVHVTANFGNQVSDTTLRLKKSGGSWKLDLGAIRLDYSDYSSSRKALSSLTAFDKPVGTGVVYMFPGFIDWGSNNGNLKVNAKPLLLDALSSYGSSYSSAPEFDLSDEAHSSILSNLRGLLDKCAGSHDLDPAGCPQRAYEYGATDGTVNWTAPSADTADISFSEYDMSARVSLQGSFGYSVQGRNGPVTGTDPFFLTGTADLSQTPPIISWD